MSSPTFPHLPLPPLFDSVKTAFHDWQKHIQTPMGEFVSIVAFKVIMLAHMESVYGYGYLTASTGSDTLTGEIKVVDEDMYFNPEVGWQGGDHFGSPAPHKLAVTATLVAGGGHDTITLDLGTGANTGYHASLTAVAGKDPSSKTALMLTGERTGNPGGRVLTTFSKEAWEKTHWPPS